MRSDFRSLKLSLGSAAILSAAFGFVNVAPAQTTTPTESAAPGTDAALDTSGQTQVNVKEQLDKGEAALKAEDFKTAYQIYNDLANAANRAASVEAYQVLVRAQVGLGKARSRP